MSANIGVDAGKFKAVGASRLSATAKYIATLMLATGVRSAPELREISGLSKTTVYRVLSEIFESEAAAIFATVPTIPDSPTIPADGNCSIPDSPADGNETEKTVPIVPPAGIVGLQTSDSSRAGYITTRATKELPSEVVISKLDTPLPPQPKFPTDYDALQAYGAFNEVAQRLGLPIASKLTPDRVRRCKARLREYGREGWDRALRNLENSKFCTGKTDAGFRADFDFMLQAKSFGRLHDGGYSDKGATRPTASAAPASRVSYDAMVEAECQRIANEMAGIQ